MRGPLLSGPLGTSQVLEAAVRHVRGRGRCVVLGPVWLATTLAEELPVLLLATRDVKADAEKAATRAQRAGRSLEVVIADDTLPLEPASTTAIVIEGLATLDLSAGEAWVGKLGRALAPGGVLVALDATDEVQREARATRAFLSAGLGGLAQERPKSGALITLGHAPSAAIAGARFQ